MGELTIRVKTLDGQTKEVKLEDTSTVLQLKEIIETKTQIATNHQKIIYRGRVLADNLLLKDQADINGSAVHVVDSNRVMSSVARASNSAQSSSNGRTRNSDRPRGRERHRTSHRNSTGRDGLRSRLYSMETWLARFEGSLTALDRGATPEDSRQFANEPEAPNDGENSNSIGVTELASLVNRAADSIERYPAALRRLHTFIRDDPLLASRSSTEFMEARSLVQNAMDASRYLHQFAQIFSSLIIPLGEVPPRNLNIIQQGNYRIPPNILVAPSNQAGLLGSLMAFEGPVGTTPGDETMTGPSADASSIFTSPPQLLISEQIPFSTQSVSQLAQQRLAEQFNRFRSPSSPYRRTDLPDAPLNFVGHGAPPMPAAPASAGLSPETSPPPAAQESQPNAPPTSQATTANINITASITPNVQINIRLPENRSTSSVRRFPRYPAPRPAPPRVNTTSTPVSQVNGNTPHANGNDAPQTQSAPEPPPTPAMPEHLSSMLPRDILNEITRSVNRFNSSGDPVVIESTGQPNQEVGRIVGEAVFQTLQNLYTTDQRPGTSSIEVLASRMPTASAPSSEAQTTQWRTPAPSEGTPESNGPTSQRRSRQAPRESSNNPPPLDSFQFTAKNNEMFMNFVFGEVENSCQKTAISGEEATLWEKVVQHVDLFQIPLKDALDLFATKTSCCRKEFMSLVNLIHANHGHVTAAFTAFIQRLFADEAPIAEANILQSNLSLLRRFLFELDLDKPGAELAAALPKFVTRWTALNCEILRGGSNAFKESIIKNFKLGKEFKKNLMQFILLAMRKSDSIDGYVLSDEPNPVTESPEKEACSSSRKRETSEEQTTKDPSKKPKLSKN